jgi:hypothetical protein
VKTLLLGSNSGVQMHILVSQTGALKVWRIYALE